MTGVSDEGAQTDMREPGVREEIEQLRGAVNDLKHDLRMLKVGMDKQHNLLERILQRFSRAGNDDRHRQPHRSR